MRSRALLISGLIAAALLTPATALADDQISFVTSNADAPADAAGCSSLTFIAGSFTCATLRDAVALASANGSGTSMIVLTQPGTLTLTEGALALDGQIAIRGVNARQTTISGAGSSRVVEVAAGATAALSGMTIADGVGDAGGDILNSGQLGILSARVTGGTAATDGGGIANVGGDLVVTNSLVDDNTAAGSGGAIANGSSGASAGTASILNSTVAFNHAPQVAGIYTTGDDGTAASIIQSTVAFNATNSSNPAGIDAESGSSIDLFGSILSGNTGDSANSNCGLGVKDQGGNVDNGFSCDFSTPDSIGGSEALSGSALEDQGGPTDVLPIAVTSPAKGLVASCESSVDQRLAPRPATDCDAGAFQEGATAPALPEPVVVPTPVPTATPTATATATPPPSSTPTPTPSASPTPTPPPTPVAGRLVVATPRSGTVLVELPGRRTFTRIDATIGVPVGSTVDARKGHVTITAVPKPGAAPQSAEFWDGIFKLTQSGGVTTLKLTQPLSCPKPKKTARRAVAAAKPKAKKVKTRQLWGNGSGAFKTQGQYSSATVRGTEWLVKDSCTTTTTRVKRGVVNVRDDVKRKTIVLRAGKRYVARAKH